MGAGLTRRSLVLVFALIVLYALTFSIFAIGRYDRYNATGWDLGIYTQLTWNAAHGRFLQNTIAEYNNFLAIHASYTTILLAPLMWVWPDPRMLLIAQSVFLGLGAWPIARLAARTFPGKGWIPPFFAALWLLYPPLGWINRWDLHPIAFAAAPLAFAFEAADRRAWRQVDIWLVLALLCKEEMGLTVAFFGLYMAWRYHRSRLPCAVWFIGGIAWFVIHAFVIFPALRDAALPIHAARYRWLWKDEVARPDLEHRVIYLFKMFWPPAFVPLLAPGALIPALPTFALNVLSGYDPQSDIYMHYNAPIIPAILVATIGGAARLRSILSRWFKQGAAASAVVLAGTAALAWMVYNPLTGSSGKTYIYGWDAGAHLTALKEVEHLIPPGACVVAENNIQAHYSVRRETYVVGARGAGPVGDADGCQYMIMDLGDRRHDDFTVGESVACYQFWSGKRAPIYFRDTVVVLEQMPAAADPDAWNQMDAYCAAFASRQ